MISFVDINEYIKCTVHQSTILLTNKIMTTDNGLLFYVTDLQSSTSLHLKYFEQGYVKRSILFTRLHYALIDTNSHNNNNKNIWEIFDSIDDEGP